MSEPKPDKQYDATYQIGGSTIHVIAPQITEEERQRRLDEVQRVIWTIWNELEKILTP
ncbi:hypothetical protein [Kroppenstedtia sanguinis]|uniref:Uncharacterized protein n=1 Tax=Kroppenstedtia sanguinis TaxID=1380684 RepID=A0ABW4C5E5_9BACL